LSKILYSKLRIVAGSRPDIYHIMID